MEAGAKDSKLWNIPRPKWTDRNFEELEALRTGKKLRKPSEYFEINRKVQNAKTKKMFDSVKLAAKHYKIGLNAVYDSCNGIQKGEQKFRYVYEKAIKSETKDK